MRFHSFTTGRSRRREDATVHVPLKRIHEPQLRVPRKGGPSLGRDLSSPEEEDPKRNPKKKGMFPRRESNPGRLGESQVS